MSCNDLSLFSDDQLLFKFQEGDELAFQEIYNRYWGLLYIHACKMLQDKDEAKDIVQELFTTLWIKGPELELKAQLSSYLYRSIRNKIINHINHERCKIDYMASLGRFFSEAHNYTEEQIREKELSVQIEQEIQCLPARMRETFELSRMSHLSHKQIADKLFVSDKTVKKQISNAIKILKYKLFLF